MHLISSDCIFYSTVNNTDITIKIDSFGLYHSFIKDMKPGLVETAQRGGHLFLLDLQQATLSLSDFKLLDNGYFVTQVKQIDDIGLKSMTKTFFPVSNSDMENLEIVMDVIKNPKNIELIYPKTINEIVDDVTVEITSQLDINFKICVKNKIATFFRSDEVI